MFATVIWDQQLRTTLVTLDKGDLDPWKREQVVFHRSRPSMEPGMLKVVADDDNEGLLFLFSGDYIYRRMTDLIREQESEE